MGVPSAFLEGTVPPSSGVPAVILLGQNPGLIEDIQNLPCVGPSGQMIRNVYAPPSLKSLATFYLFNTARCFTPLESPPKQRHYNACFSHTLSDIREVISCHTSSSLSPTSSALAVSSSSPSSSSSPLRIAVLCLGAPASFTFLKAATGKGKSLTEAFKLQGHKYEIPSTLGPASIDFFSTFHPNAVNRKPALIHAVKDHIQLLHDWITGLIVSPSSPNLVECRPPRTLP